MKTVALCGSTRFRPLFELATRQLSLRGYVVYSLAMFGRQATDQGKPENELVSDEDKLVLDAVHMAKIANSNSVLIITDGSGYVGDSTRREIFFARIMGKPVRALHWTPELERLATHSNFRSEDRPCPELP